MAATTSTAAQVIWRQPVRAAARGVVADDLARACVDCQDLIIPLHRGVDPAAVRGDLNPVRVPPDGHGTDTLSNIRYAVATARRGWLRKDHVTNTREWPDLNALRKRS